MTHTNKYTPHATRTRTHQPQTRRELRPLSLQHIQSLSWRRARVCSCGVVWWVRWAWLAEWAAKKGRAKKGTVSSQPDLSPTPLSLSLSLSVMRLLVPDCMGRLGWVHANVRACVLGGIGRTDTDTNTTQGFVG